MEHNKYKLEEIDNQELNFLYYLMVKIEDNQVMNMDKETMVPFTTRGFMYHNDTLIIFNER